MNTSFLCVGFSFRYKTSPISIYFSIKHIGVDSLHLKEDNGKITLPKELQKQMLKFFLKTSIPRIKQEKLNALSENSDRSDSE